MITPRPGLPSFYVTSLAKILVGEQPCHLEAWAKAHLQLPKTPQSPQMAAWKVNHTAMLTTEVDGLNADGWKTTVEQFFRLTGTTAILSGKPDVICQKKDARPKIVDIKSGSPKESDMLQVQIYMIAIPLAWESPSMIFEGEVVYSTHRVKIEAHEVGPVKERLFPLLRKLAGAQKPDPSPSESSCKFCEVPDEVCGSRWVGETPNVLVSEW